MGAGARALLAASRAPRLRGALGLLLALPLFAAPAAAQATDPPPDKPCKVKMVRGLLLPARLPAPVYGNPGDDVIVGTPEGGDDLRDTPGGDHDTMLDAPGTSDGKRDFLDMRDGDNLDSAYGGPEDIFLGDPGDKVYIVRDQQVIWHGTITEYYRAQAVLRWLRDRYQCLIDEYLSVGEAPDWPAIVDEASDLLAAVQPSFAQGNMTVGETFALGPYEDGELPESPHGFLWWLPYDESNDDVPALAGAVTMNAEEYDGAVDCVMLLLADLSASLAAGTPPDATGD